MSTVFYLFKLALSCNLVNLLSSELQYPLLQSSSTTCGRVTRERNRHVFSSFPTHRNENYCFFRFISFNCALLLCNKIKQSLWNLFNYKVPIYTYTSMILFYANAYILYEILQLFNFFAFILICVSFMACEFVSVFMKKIFLEFLGWNFSFDRQQMLWENIKGNEVK